MILVDALYIDGSGGLVLLRYLADELEKRQLYPYYIIDVRCGKEFEDIPIGQKCIMKASLRARRKWYKENSHQFDKVLCFGNIPPSVPIHNSTCYTYFHNINMLNIPSQLPLKIKLLSWLKRVVYILLKTNTDYWIVQTDNTKDELVKHLKETSERVKIIPFYNIERSLYDNTNRKGYVYASNYNSHKNFEFVVEVWAEMARNGITPELHLTLGDAPTELFEKIKLANKIGARIINHGMISQRDLFSLYRQCKALVYAAINESLGLCLIEAIENGCDVIAPELPYVHAICKPSKTFNINCIESLIQAILEYEKGICTKTQITVHNQIDEMIGLLS